MSKSFILIPLLIACDGYSNSLTATVTVQDYYEATDADYSSYGFGYTCKYISDPAPAATPDCDYCTNYGYVKLDYYNESYDDLDENDESICSALAFGFNTDVLEAYVGGTFDKLEAREFGVTCEMVNDFSATCTNAKTEDVYTHTYTHDYKLELSW